MRITWHPGFERHRALSPSKPSAAHPAIAESHNPALEAMEQEVLLMAAVVTAELASCRMGRGISQEDSTFSHFLADMNQFEGRFRGILLDPSLSRYQTARLNRIFRTYQKLRPVTQLRRHIEFPIRALAEHNDFIQLELSKAVSAVMTLGRRATFTLHEPGWAGFLEAHAAHEQAQAQLAEARKRFQAVLSPEAYRAVQASLLALDIICAAFLAIAQEHAEILRPEILNQMGSPLPRTIENNVSVLI